jgi:hypothetical protein
MDFCVQVAGWDDAGRYFPPDVQDIQAMTALEAAETLCGKGLLESGDRERLAATVWSKDNPKGIYTNFFRPPNQVGKRPKVAQGGKANGGAPQSGLK